MRWRWAAWFGGIFVLALLVLLPLRVAIAPITERGFTARQVAGTIWYGRIGELMFHNRRLGTFEVRAALLPLLVGSTKIRFSRMGDPEGQLDGELSFGRTSGVHNLNGRLAAAGMLGNLPIASIETSDVTLLFRDGRCIEAEGQVRALLAVPIPGNVNSQLSGTMRCERERVRFRLADPTGNVSLEFYVSSQGRYRAWLRLSGIPTDVATGLAMAGFRPSPTGLVMSADGRW